LTNGTPSGWRRDRTWKHGTPSSLLPRPCRHPRDKRRLTDLGEACACGHIFDPVVKARGRNNKKRGMSIQRQVANLADMTHVPGSQPEDARDSAFYAEIKSGPSWYSVRVEAELDALPNTKMPLFIAASTPGPGTRRRVYATVTLGDLVKLIGPHAQVSCWLPDWVALKKEAGVTRE
jgi:hypothetical protein